MTRVIATVTLLLGFCAAAEAQSLILSGKFGYLSEYELTATLAATGAQGYAGTMTVRHVGLCTHEGPPEVDGRITLKLADARVTAVLSFDGRECTFIGTLSEADFGELACPGAAVPASLWSQ
jgi:hypothetical protein